MRIYALASSIAALSLITNVSLAQQPTEGVHYEPIREPFGVAENVVISVFSPPCPHCYRLEEPLAEWIDDNGYELERVPFFHDDRWVRAGRLILAMQQTGHDAEELMAALFDAIHEKAVADDDVAGLLASLPIDDGSRSVIAEALGSSEVRDRESQIRAWLEANRIVVVPTVVLSDRFYSDPARSRGNENLMLLLDHLNHINQ